MRNRLVSPRLEWRFSWLLLIAAALPAQSPKQPGKLAITSVPKGASIFVNGSKMSQPTDATFVVSPGNYRVSVTGGAGNLNCPTKPVTVSGGSQVDLHCSAAGWGTKPK
jgi:PEGA domain